MNLQLLTPDKSLTLPEVDSVTATTPDGEIGILKNHIPLLTPVTVSMFKVKQARQRTQAFAVMGGVLYTDGKTITLLCEAADSAADIDAVRAEDALRRAEARLKSKDSALNLDRAQLALSRAMARIKAVSTYVSEKN
jgi:F-type H+-transporting ATPase subunit epsilon